MLAKPSPYHPKPFFNLAIVTASCKFVNVYNKTVHSDPYQSTSTCYYKTPHAKTQNSLSHRVTVCCQSANNNKKLTPGLLQTGPRIGYFPG